MAFKHFAAVLFFVAFQMVTAQTIYKDSVFSKVTKTTYTYGKVENESLQFDYYKADNSGKKLPLVVFVHGGGFSGGTRDNNYTMAFANKLAQRGYAVASVSYRLTMKDIGFGCDVEATKKIEAFNSASHDVSLAIKYILDNYKKFNIDRNKIILAGSSAGAETVLNMVYVYDNNILPANFKFAGVISMAGALSTLDKINDNTAIPTQLFHGTADNLVPYHFAPHRFCNANDKGYIMLYGSESIAEHLKSLESPYYFHTIKGGSHDWSYLPMTAYFEEIIDFLYHDVVHVTTTRQTNRTTNN